MGQQPNIELTEAEQPRQSLDTAPARRWRPTKPGLITSPEQNPSGGAFGSTGPDAGWAYRILRHYELPSDDPDLKSVVAALTMARAGSSGRAPVREDIEVALIFCGFWENAPKYLKERLERWLDAVPHDVRPGQTAVADVDAEDLVRKPEQIRYTLTRDPALSPDNTDS